MSTTTPSRSQRSNGADRAPTAALGAPAEVPRGGGWRDRVRSKPGLREAYRLAVFVAGLLFMAIGVALMALPGPLTIPPVLLGLWIWSTEFRFAKRFFDTFARKADDAWEHARAHPVSSVAVTVGGLVAAGAAFWAAQHFALVDRAKDAVL